MFHAQKIHIWKKYQKIVYQTALLFKLKIICVLPIKNVTILFMKQFINNKIIIHNKIFNNYLVKLLKNATTSVHEIIFIIVLMMYIISVLIIART